jgi:serine/threonine protein kinase
MTVLFSESRKCWKITDFGTASEATSKHMNTTRYARGTASYRAPEVIAEDSRFNNRADIWALGCIIYEMSTGVRLFRDDYSVLQYSATKMLEMPVELPTFDDAEHSSSDDPLSNQWIREVGMTFRSFSSFLLRMLNLVPTSRPNSQDIIVQFLPYRIDVDFEMPYPGHYWTPAEIHSLVLYLPTFRTDWDMIAGKVGTKTGKQVKNSLLSGLTDG